MTRPYIGGQAVLEGVMMRSPKSFVVAVRRPDGSIAVREQAWDTLWPKLTFLRWPVLRGAVVLLESLHNGYSALTFSAEQAMPAEDSASADGPSTGSSLMLTLATVFMAGLFIAAPHLLTYGFVHLLHLPLTTQSLGFQVLDGGFRIAILLGYILAISRSKDAQRLFQYHGAEHKAIWTYESKQPLTVENAQRFSTLHPRCGTSFLFVVVGVAVLLHMALIPFLPVLSPNERINSLLLLLVKVPLALPIAGFAYELQRLSAKESAPRLLTWLVRPGIWLQRVTTKPPTDDQMEIALLALERALAREEGRSQVADGVRVYQDFGVALAA